jgi:hypothetical protein
MSGVNGISSSASVSYGTQLAQTSALRRSLNKLGAAVQDGDLTSAGSILSAIIKANPQYATGSGSGAQSQDPVNQDFQALADAISNNQADAAKSAWTQVKSDLAKSGVTDLSDGTAATAALLAKTKASISQQIVSDAFGVSSSGGISVTSLLGGTSDSSSTAGLSSSLIGSWLTYQAGGNASPLAAAGSTGNVLDTTA